MLVLPHHGRHNVLAAALLETVGPSLALVSNREGEGRTPQAEIARRVGIAVLETGRRGTITVTAGERVVVTTERPLLLR